MSGLIIFTMIFYGFVLIVMFFFRMIEFEDAIDTALAHAIFWPVLFTFIILRALLKSVTVIRAAWAATKESDKETTP